MCESGNNDSSTLLLDEWTKESWRRGELVPNAGHWLAEEQPQKLVELRLDFFAEN